MDIVVDRKRDRDRTDGSIEMKIVRDMDRNSQSEKMEREDRERCIHR